MGMKIEPGLNDFYYSTFICSFKNFVIPKPLNFLVGMTCKNFNLRHLIKCRKKSFTHLAQLLVTLDKLLILGILQLIVFNVGPHSLDNLEIHFTKW